MQLRHIGEARVVGAVSSFSRLLVKAFKNQFAFLFYFISLGPRHTHLDSFHCLCYQKALCLLKVKIKGTPYMIYLVIRLWLGNIKLMNIDIGDKGLGLLIV